MAAIMKSKPACKIGPWLASVSLALKIPSQQLNDKGDSLFLELQSIWFSLNTCFPFKSEIFICDQHLVNRGCLPDQSPTHSLDSVFLMATCAQKHHTHIAVFCVTSNGRERAYINLYMHFSRLCLRVFPYSSAMYPYYISVKKS